MLDVDEDTTNNTLAKVLRNDIVAIEIDTELRVFPNNFTMEDAEVDNMVKVLGIDFTILATELDNALIVFDIARLIVTVETMLYDKAIR
jgi:predicted transcriptional regulator